MVHALSLCVLACKKTTITASAPQHIYLDRRNVQPRVKFADSLGGNNTTLGNVCDASLTIDRAFVLAREKRCMHMRTTTMLIERICVAHAAALRLCVIAHFCCCCRRPHFIIPDTSSSSDTPTPSYPFASFVRLVDNELHSSP